MVTYQQDVLTVEGAVVLVQVCAWDPSGGSMQGRCNRRTAGQTQAQTDTVMGVDVAATACQSEKWKGPLAPSLGSMSTAPCTSSAVGAEDGGQRAQEFEGRPKDPKDQCSMRGVVVVVVVAAVVVEDIHMDSMAWAA